MLTLHESNNLHLPVRFLEPTITMASYHLRRTFIKGLSCFRRRNIKKFSILFVLTLFILYLFHQQFQLGLRDFLYLTRPIWDSDVENFPQHRIVHFHSANLVPAARCALHGWTEREKAPKVFDAFIFSNNEVDMLEIRLKELWPVVDHFLIVEAYKTFTG